MAFYVQNISRLLSPRTQTKQSLQLQILNITSSSSPYLSKLFHKHFAASNSLNDTIAKLSVESPGNDIYEHPIDLEEDKNRLCITYRMTDISKKDVKLYLDKNENGLHIQVDKPVDRHCSVNSAKVVNLIPSVYKTDQIKAKMNCGDLKIFIPKINGEEKLEEKPGVVPVSID
ncbi:23.5 kDa heat shock protein, mitochondrial-like [Mercurialis annua]|uniref:23.5 kDa heat shock protein, mitochondrial-like n=1 Tax=Mercurialis annua TaxID=3986 RepID=UPI00215ED48C|nr:23.5 kDa heat shock protein, mitochondrial-like [Mercurialis annua]